MKKKIFSIAILSILLLTIAAAAVDDIKKAATEIKAPTESKNLADGPGAALDSPAFHETQFSSATTLSSASVAGTVLLTQSVFVPVGGAELTVTFSGETDTTDAQGFTIVIQNNGVNIPPGPVYFDRFSGEDGWGAHSFTYGSFVTPGWHTIRAVAYGSGTIWYKSLETEIEEW